MTFHQFDFGELFRQNGKKSSNSAQGIGWKHQLISIAITLALAFLYFYFTLPALNFQSMDFYIFLLLTLGAYLVVSMIVGGILGKGVSFASHAKRNGKIALILGGIIVAVLLVNTIVFSHVFQAKKYASILVPETREFSEDVAEISFDQIPMLDADSAMRLGDRKMGELSDLVSQFEVSSNYVQINYHGRPTRVTYLEYGDLFKWFNNHSEGLPAYILIDMVTQEVTVQRMEEGMKYAPSDLFGHDLMRKLRFSYPTVIFDEVNFEIDENGQPYWIASVLTKRIGLLQGEDVKGAVLLNAVTGESQYYDVEEIPQWVDRVYSADLIMEQYDNHGTYQGGFLNSMFGQRGVTVTTDGCNYIAINDDVWLYTGVTSVTGDESNVGFLLVNQRTGEPRYYVCPGATEYSARQSAEGAVQHLGYTATFPLLLNISNEPTYFTSLKDASSLVKMYAMVNVGQYQIVATGSTVQECQENYEELLVNAHLVEETKPEEPEQLIKQGTIAHLRSAVLEGNTYFYIQLTGGSVWYRVSAVDCPLAVIADEGDRVVITYVPGEGEILDALTMKRD